MPTRRDLGNFIVDSKTCDSFYQLVIKNYNLGNEEVFKKLLKRFYHQYIIKWRKCYRSKTRFEEAHKLWLDEELTLPTVVENRRDDEGVPSTSSGKRGRPKKKFEEAQERTKKKIIKSEADRLTTPQAVRVLSSRLRRKGNRAGSACVKLFGTESPGSSKKLHSKLKKDDSKLKKSLSPKQALSLLVEAKLTKRSYSLIRMTAKMDGADIYPSYKKLLDAKQMAYPKNINATEKCCDVPLQDLLNHTAARILETLGNHLEGKYNLICKWGFDGSSGQSEYKQRWEEEGSRDDSIFLSSFVPLRLEGENGAAWVNPRPCSTRFCRPIRLPFIKETKEVITSEEHHIKTQIMELKPLKVREVQIDFIMLLTMINGKVLCALTETSTQQCPICKGTARGSWDQSSPPDEAALQYGISPLHAYIRFLEFILVISYRLGTKAKLRGDKCFPEVREQKERVLQKLAQKMHLKPDRPKQGFGSTSDGNTARRFFADPRTASEATGVNAELIKRFSAILCELSCGREINTEIFEAYCLRTLSLYKEIYSWFPLTPTVHKILAHSTLIVKCAILPLGQLSKEAQEARNKDVRNYRQFFTRKTKKRLHIEDLFRRLLLSSDPVITSARPLPKKNIRKLTEEVNYFFH